MAQNMLFFETFLVFLCDGALEKVDIYVKKRAEFPQYSVKAPSHSDNSLQMKALDGAKNGRKWSKIGIFGPTSRFSLRWLVDKG